MNVPLPKFQFESYTKKEFNEIKRKFNIYLQASEVKSKPSEVQVAHLRLCLDERINDIIDNRELNSNKTVDEVFAGLEEELIPKDGVCFQQLEFYKRSQKPGESFQSFYLDLQNIAKYCDFGTQLDNCLKMRILFGIRDENLKERLYRNPELALKDIVQHCKAAEEAKSKLIATKTEYDKTPVTPTQEIMGVEKAQYTPRNPSFRRYPHAQASNQRPQPIQQHSRHALQHVPGRNTYSRYQSNTQSSSRCGRCLRTHGRNCPAYGKVCRICRKPNHFEKACRYASNNSRNKVRVVQFDNVQCQEEKSNNEELFTVGQIHQVNSNPEKGQWFQKFKLQNKEIVFKLDTGADLNVIPITELQKFGLVNKIRLCNTKAETYGGYPLNFIGIVKLKLVTDKTYLLDFHVLEAGKGVIPILGATACVDMGLVKRLHIDQLENSIDKEKFVEKFKPVYQGIGKFPYEYDINEQMALICQ
ncbi:hypothetical protein WDU94_012387 [Cyamophila willieti]